MYVCKGVKRVAHLNRSVSTSSLGLPAALSVECESVSILPLGVLMCFSVNTQERGLPQSSPCKSEMRGRLEQERKEIKTL